MNEAMIAAIEALAIRPELLTVAILAVVIAIMTRRRAKLSAKRAATGSPTFKLVINRLTWVMLVLASVTIARELATAAIAIWGD